jgi:hypothetical protein
MTALVQLIRELEIMCAIFMIVAFVMAHWTAALLLACSLLLVALLLNNKFKD